MVGDPFAMVCVLNAMVFVSNTLVCEIKTMVFVANTIVFVMASKASPITAGCFRSSQPALWGINLYPDLSGDDFLEYDSMINLRPSRGNRSRSIDDPLLRERIRKIVDSLVMR
jgi:hypothetical protein